MAERIFIFRAGSEELVLPMTPDSYRVDTGVNIEIVNIHQLGDAVVLGYGTLATIKIGCMFPDHSYPLARDTDPEHYVEVFQRWIQTGQKLRFIVGDTGVNIPVYVENISWGERDGTNDIYADIVLREFRELAPVQMSAAPVATAPRAEVQSTKSTQTIPIVKGDTLSAICRKYYGDGSKDVYTRLAKYNNIPNPDLIYAGKTLEIPQPLPQ